MEQSRRPSGDVGKRLVRLEHLVQLAADQAPTLARAYGVTISRLLNQRDADSANATAAAGPLDWMDWERRKTLRLLFPKR